MKRALDQLGIRPIAAYSPEARGRSERMFGTHHRHHYVKCTVGVHEDTDGALAIFHGPRCLGRYQADGRPVITDQKAAA